MENIINPLKKLYHLLRVFLLMYIASRVVEFVDRNVQLTSFCLADDSTKRAFHESARRLPSSVAMTLSTEIPIATTQPLHHSYLCMCRSDLLPTNTSGTLFEKYSNKNSTKISHTHLLAPVISKILSWITLTTSKLKI